MTDKAFKRRCAILAACVLSCALSCKRHPTSKRVGIRSPLERCIAKAYEGGGHDAGAQSSQVAIETRSCLERYVKEPRLDRWATRLGASVGPEIFRKGDDVFVQKFVECARRNGMIVDVVETGAGSRRIEVRRAKAGMTIGSNDPTFRGCADSAEKGEQEVFATIAAQNVR